MNTRARLIQQPQTIPVVGTDAHLPPLSADRLTVGALRQQLRAAGTWAPELRGDGGQAGSRLAMRASVLVPIVTRPDPTVLLTRRTEHLRDHAGQISFPGGRWESGDEDAVATALREAEEEVGLMATHVEVLGPMPVYSTVTAYEVTPVVALVRPGFAVRPDPFEVAEVFEVPLSFLMTPAHHRRHVFETAGQRRQFLSMPWRGRDADGQDREYFIWGATAAMLRNLYALLRADPGGSPSIISP